MADNMMLAFPEDSEDFNLNKLLQITQNNVMNNSYLSQQMGIVVNTMGKHDQRFDAIEQQLAQQDIRITQHERTVTLTNYQTKQMYQAVGHRVTELVGYPNPYYGRFKRKLWNDAKAHSKMAQEYKFTLQIDFDEVMEYIGSWYPSGYSGVEAYKQHLDEIRNDGWPVHPAQVVSLRASGQRVPRHCPISATSRHQERRAASLPKAGNPWPSVRREAPQLQLVYLPRRRRRMDTDVLATLPNHLATAHAQPITPLLSELAAS